MNKYKVVVYVCYFALLLICAWDIYLGYKDNEWFNLIALVVSVTIGILLSKMVHTNPPSPPESK